MTEPSIDFGEELTRVVDFLRSMPLAKLSRPVADESRIDSVGGMGDSGATRAQLARGLAQWLADTAAQVQGRPLREVPDVGDVAVGDQIAVTGAELLRAEPDAALLAEASERLRALRLSL